MKHNSQYNGNINIKPVTQARGVMIKLTTPDGSPITKWQGWTRPKKEYHWKAGRSAMELAKSWFRNDVLLPPQEFLSLFNTSPHLGGLRITSGIPELVTALPERGEGRNHDLALIGKTDSVSVTICVEAKADESFGNDTIFEYWDRMFQQRQDGKSTRLPERIEQLLAMVNPEISNVEKSEWKDIRYQLLTAICGTILQARIDGSNVAVLVVHEFRTASTSDKKHKQNHTELERLMSVVSGGVETNIEAGKLYGSFKMGGIDLMIGKVITTL